MIEERNEIEQRRRMSAHSFFIDPIRDSHPRIRLGPRPPDSGGRLRVVFETKNIELRRELIEKEYGGYERFFKTFPDFHRILEKTEEGTLHLFESSARGSSFKMAVLEVSDSSHTREHYFLPVPREIKTVHEARAWTFGMTPEEFHPIIET